MSAMDSKVLLNYSEVRARWKGHPLQLSEVPIEHRVSLPLPTLRWRDPAFVFRASPTFRRPDKVSQAPADRWWALAAHGGRLLGYALESAVPLGSSPAWTQVSPPARPIKDQQEQLAIIASLMDALAGPFFAMQAADPAMREALHTALRDFVGPELFEEYTSSAPDFFEWLRASAGSS